MLVDLLFVVALIGLLFAIYKIKFSKENIHQEIEEATRQAKLRQQNTDRQQQIIKNKDSKEEKDQKIETNTNSQVAGWQNSESEDESDDEQGIDRKKQLRKQQKKQQKQQRKQAHQHFLEQEKEKRQKYEKQAEERERAEEEKRRKQEQIIQQLRQEQRKRKEQEFNKWKNMFSVEEEGKQKLSEEEERRKNQIFNKQLIGILKASKLSLLQDLSHKFKLTTKQVVQKIKKLEQENCISGIFDERGKYLVIEENEWAAIKNYILARGRVKKTDIMVECAKLIKIPQNVQEDLLKLVADEDQKSSQ